VLAQLAQVLRVPLSRLLDDPAAPVSDRPSTTNAGMVLYRALTQPIVPYEPPPLAELHGHVRSAWRIWQTSSYRYSKLVNQLPVLITDTALAEQRYQSEGERPERRQVQCCAVDLYGLLRTVAKRVGRGDLSLLVADRAIRAAETLAPYVQAGDLDATSLCGALTLLSAVASVRQGQVWTARERVRAVAPLAERTGERNIYWTAFGPTEDMAHRPAAHQLLRTVIHRGRRGVATEAAQLANRVGLSIG
jgi:hypothetical protein